MDKQVINLECINKKLDSEDIIKKINCEEDDIVYLAGSAIERKVSDYSKDMGNLKSDLDIFILRNTQKYKCYTSYEYDHNFRKVNFVSIDKVSFDIEIYDVEDIENLVNKINLIKLNKDKRILNTLKLDDGWNLEEVNSFFNRMLYSIPILNTKKFNELKSRISFGKFAGLYINYILNIIDNKYDDLVGNLIDRQLDTALFNIRGMFLNLLQLIIYKEGEYVDRKKWIILKFMNIAEIKNKYAKELAAYKKLFLSDQQDKDILENTVRQSMKFLNNAIEFILMDMEEEA